MRLGVLSSPGRQDGLRFGRFSSRERILSVFRVLMAGTLLSALPLILPLAGPHHFALSVTLWGYAVTSLALLLTLWGPAPGPRAIVLIHLSDVFWPSLLCWFTGCLASPFLLLLMFALLAAPYRRAVPKAVMVSLLGILVLLGESAPAVSPSFHPLHVLQWTGGPESFPVQAAILLVLGAFLSYTARWTERERQTDAVQSVLRCLRSDVSIPTNVREILPVLVELFAARRVILVLRGASGLHAFQWGIGDSSHEPMYRNLSESRQGSYFWPVPLESSSMACSRRGRRMSCIALDRQARRVPVDSVAFASRFAWDQPFRTLLVRTLQFGSEWSGRIFVVDPSYSGGREFALRLLHRLADEVGPALYNFSLWQRTTERVRVVERRRLARDLHDGVIQSLIATDMQLELLRRGALSETSARAVAETVFGVQAALRNEVRKLREEIDRLRDGGVDPDVRPRLTDLLDSFQRDSGILTRFFCDVDQDAIPGKIREDLIRVLEEALSNVRRHSGATTVEVRLTAHDNAWEMVIQDDGRGFDFSGSLSLAQLEGAQEGPQSIRERVQCANGDLTLESYPDRGASVRVRLAQPTMRDLALQ